MANHNIVNNLPKQFTPHPSNSRFINLTGRRFNRLTVLGYSHKKINAFWYVQCDCGTLKVLNARTLINGSAGSCGCLNKELLSINKRTHGHSVNRQPTPEFEAFYHAKRRCQNPLESNYHNYGGRGIEFRFTSLQEFLNDVGMRPNDSFSLDRIDNNGHYEKGNIRWVNKSQQARNRRTSHLITLGEQIKTVAEWSEETGIKYFTISRRHARGWCDECSVSNVKTCIHREKAKIGRPKKVNTAS